MKYLILSLLILTSCTVPSDKDFAARIQSGVQEHSVILIDYCEYIVLTNRPYSADMTITHKGNCTNPIHCYNK